MSARAINAMACIVGSVLLIPVALCWYLDYSTTCNLVPHRVFHTIRTGTSRSVVEAKLVDFTKSAVPLNRLPKEMKMPKHASTVKVTRYLYRGRTDDEAMIFVGYDLHGKAVVCYCKEPLK